MKATIIIILSLITAYSSLAQSKASVYIIRATGIYGSAVSFKAFIDHELVCRLYNNEFSKHEVDPGVHTFSVQFYGKKEKASSEQIEINTESGKEYYIEMIYERDFMSENLLCAEVTPESAKRILLPKCNKKTLCR